MTEINTTMIIHKNNVGGNKNIRQIHFLAKILLVFQKQLSDIEYLAPFLIYQNYFIRQSKKDLSCRLQVLALFRFFFSDVWICLNEPQFTYNVRGTVNFKLPLQYLEALNKNLKNCSLVNFLYFLLIHFLKKSDE